VSDVRRVYQDANIVHGRLRFGRLQVVTDKKIVDRRNEESQLRYRYVGASELGLDIYYLDEVTF
jgi:hypothetical protein